MGKHILLSASALMSAGAGVLALSPSAAFAQEAEGAEQVDTIIVTAQRREERLQDVPLAVSAFSQQSLDDRQIDNAADLQLVVPNFSYTATNFGGVNYTIRGIGASVLGDGADSGVALHYNGAFLQGGGNSNLYYDVEAVEVLRGPQGTLFGRNATGGAVNLRTRRPGDEFEAHIEGGIGSFDGRGVEGALNVPLGENVAARFAFTRVYSDGDVRNVVTGNRINGDDAGSARLSLRWTPTSSTTINATATYLRATGDGMQAEKRMCNRDPIGNLGCLPDRLDYGIPNYSATLSGLIATGVGLISPGGDPFQGSVEPRNMRQVAMDFDPRVFTEDWIATVEIEQAWGPITLNALTAYAHQDGFYETDSDFAVAAGVFQPSGFFPGGFVPVSRPDPDNLGSLADRTLGVFNRPFAFERGDGVGRQWMQEIRIASNYEGRFNFLLGAFYLDFERRENLYNVSTPLDAAGLLLGAAPPFFRLETPVADLRSYAAFGEAYFDLSERFGLTLGARWTHDEKEQVNRSLLLNLPVAFGSNSLEDEAVTGRVVLDWQGPTAFGDDTLVYASYARGYKGGGFNPQGVVAVPPQFDPEFVNAYEVGAKNVWGAGYVNAAAFLYQYDGLQVSKIVNRTSVNENIDADIWGAELEAGFAFQNGVSLDFNLAHLRSEIGAASSIDPRDPTGGQAGLIAIKDENTGENCVATLGQLATLLGGVPFGDCAALGLSPGAPVSLNGNALANAPEWTATVGAQYERAIFGNLQGRVRLDYSWRSDFWGRIFNRDPIDRIASWGSLNGQIEIERDDQSWYVRLEGSNLLDEDAVTGMYLTDATSGLATNLFLLPSRRVALVIGARF